MKKGILLIVDDEPVLLRLLQDNLEDIPEKILIASNGVEALEVLDRELVHCVVCDINMPKMNGVEVIKKVRECNNEVPFIFYTGHGSKDLMVEAAKYGAFDFLDKPNLHGLEEVVERGLTVGTHGQLKARTPEDFQSEFQKMLSDFED